MAVISPEDFAAILANMPQDMAEKAAATAAAAGGAAAEAVEIFETVDAGVEAGLIASVKALMAASWKARAATFLVQTLIFLGIEKAALWVISKGFSSGFALAAGLWPDITSQMALGAYKNLDSFTPIGLNLTASIYEHIFPNSMNADQITSSFAHPPGPADGPDANSDFFGVLGSSADVLFRFMFDVPGVVRDIAGRVTDTHSQKNFERVMGANLGLQIRAQTMAIVAQMFPLGPFKHLPEMHRGLINAMGLSRLAHTMLSVLSSSYIHAGLQRNLNRTLLPRDLSESEALDLNLMVLLDDATMGLILDNQGVRHDIRDPLRQMRATDFTENQAAQAFIQGRIDQGILTAAYNHHKVIPARRNVFTAMAELDLPDTDVQNLFQKGRIDDTDVFSHFRLKGYGPDRAALERDTILDARTWDLLDKVTESYGRLYRDEVIGEQEFRTWLSSNNWTDAEIDLRIAWEELERRQRTFLSNSDLGTAVSDGILTSQDMYDELTGRGYTPEDAVVIMTLQLQKHLPACDKEKIKDDALIAFLQSIGVQAGVNPGLLKPQILKYLQCLNEAVPLVLPIVSIKATPSQISFPGQVELEWETEFATSATIDHGIGSVPLSGKTLVEVHNAESFTITGKNPLGQSKAYAFVQGLVATITPSNLTVTLAADKTTVNAGEVVLLSWSSTGADRASIDRGVGEVPVNGTWAITPTTSGGYTITVSAGTDKATAFVDIRVIPKEKVVKPPLPNPPTAQLEADASQINQGDAVTLRWFTTGADFRSIDGGVGSVPAQGTIVLRPNSNQIYTLSARNAGGTSQAYVAVTVIPKPAVQPPTKGPVPIIRFQASVHQINQGEQVMLTWQTENALSVTIDHGVGGVPLNGSWAVSPASSTGYTLTAHGNGVSAFAYAQVIVIPKPPAGPKPPKPLPDAPILTPSLISWTPLPDGSITISGDISSLNVPARVRAQNAVTLATAEVTADSTGAWTVSIKAASGEAVQVYAFDPYGRYSSSVIFTLP